MPQVRSSSVNVTSTAKWDVRRTPPCQYTTTWVRGHLYTQGDRTLTRHYAAQNIAAQQGHRDACFALTAWYLVGSPGVLPQSDTEAYLWAKKAAEMGLAKAQYAVGYFTEVCPAPFHRTVEIVC